MRSLLLACSLAALHLPAASEDFVFGTASASYQYEGAAAADGRGPSIWDAFCSSKTPLGTPRCFRNENASIATDQYNLTRLAGDISRMVSMGTKAYRLSLSWSRIMPSGRFPLEPRGLEHYRKVLSLLLGAGIEPYVTMFHFDLPLALERESNGWLNASTVDAFVDYADVCFRELGDLVKQWMTINEPHTIATAGYLYGVAAPGRCSNRSLCSAGNGTVEPYLVAHNLLLAHGRAADLYRRRYRDSQLGQVTLVVSGDWTEPFNADMLADREAAERRQVFQIAWFVDPVAFGDYPALMRRLVGHRLPRFSETEKDMLRGSMDYFALNHYTSRFAKDLSECFNSSVPSAGWESDQCLDDTPIGPDGRAIGPVAGSDWLLAVPWGLRRLLNWISKRYTHMPIIITENGCDDPVNASFNDSFRITYHEGYLRAVQQALVIDRIDVRGYFVWSLLDNFEWADGFQKRFGLYHVDDDGPGATLTRTPKASVAWLTDFIRRWSVNSEVRQVIVA